MEQHYRIDAQATKYAYEVLRTNNYCFFFFTVSGGGRGGSRGGRGRGGGKI